MESFLRTPLFGHYPEIFCITAQFGMIFRIIILPVRHRAACRRHRFSLRCIKPWRQVNFYTARISPNYSLQRTVRLRSPTEQFGNSDSDIAKL